MRSLHLPLAAILSVSATLFSPLPLSAQLSREEFRNPPLQARPSCLWSWLNGHVDHKQITRELEEMKANGMRGAIIWDVGSLINPDHMIPAGPQFLGPESLKAIHHAMDEAARLGLELGLFASSSWNAGGTWITPKDGSKALLISELKVDGPRSFSGPLPLPEKTTEHHEDVAVLAVPDDSAKTVASATTPIRLDSSMSTGGMLQWDVPAGAWRILRFVRNNTGEFLNCPSPNSKGLVIDHLSKEATDSYLVHILDKLKESRQDYGPMKRLMLDSYEVRPGIDWTPDFVSEFTKRNGYDPVPWLPVLAGWTVADKELSARFEHDYRKMVSDLMVDNHFARCRELLNQRGLQLLAEGGHGGHPRVDPLKALGAADIPMGEFWNHRKNWVTKEAASAANIYDRKFVAAESFTGWQNWQDGPSAYKRLLDIALCAGLNQVYFHTFSHNPPSAGLPGNAYHAGEHFNVNNTWWKQAGPMLEDMSRACHLLQQGKFVADICVYYGDEAPNLVPARRIAPTIKSQWPDDKCAHCGRLKPVNLDSLGEGYDYDYLNEEVILTRMTVEDGKLVLPNGIRYRMMVLPDRKTISPSLLKKLGEFIEAGATIIGPKPERSNSLRGYPECDQEVRELADRIWGDCDGEKVKTRNHGKGKIVWNFPLGRVLANMGVERDFVPEGIDNSGHIIDYIHRATETEDIYFVSNSSLEHQSVRCRFRAGVNRVPSFWIAEDGSVKPCLAYETKDGFTWVTLDLAPASSIFVVFGPDEKSEHVVEIKASSPAKASPRLELLSIDDKQLTARAWRTGTWEITTFFGRKGSLVVRDVPEPRRIDGPWKITFPKERGAPESIIMETLEDWTRNANPGVKYFSSGATYHRTITLDTFAKGEPLFLDLGTVKEVAVVAVNGKQAGILWKEPRRIDIAPFVKPGQNQLEITVVNTWNNRIVGDLNAKPEDRVTRTNILGKFNPKSPLLPSGLLGPVTLHSPMRATGTWK
ncbi:MAG: glycosyl hydrolase [Verrucomicrobiales bacterium]